MHVPPELRYARTHEWAGLNSDGTISVGITWHAQDRLGDLVYVENPPIGKSFAMGEECGVVESVKAASDIYAPVAGSVVAVNDELSNNPEKINEDAYAAWMFKLKPEDPSQLQQLLDAADYQAMIAAEDH